MKHRFVLSTPLLSLLCFGLLAFLPVRVLTDLELFPNSILPLATLLAAGLLSVLIGSISSIIIANRRKQPQWLLIALGCVLSLFLLAVAIVRAIPGPSH